MMREVRFKVPLMFTLLFLALSGILYLSLLARADRVLYQLELSNGIKGGEAVRNFLDHQARQLDLLCLDWASWDQMYHFVEGRMESFERQNLSYESLENAEVSHGALFRRDLTVVWHGKPEGRIRSVVPCAPEELTKLRETVIRAERYGYARGLTVMSDRILMVSARQVKDTAMGLPYNGWLVLARPLASAGELRRVLPSLVDVRPSQVAMEPKVVTVPVSPSVMETRVPLMDITGRWSMEARLRVDRWIAMGLRELMGMVLVGIAMLGVSLGTAIFLWHRTSISQPLEEMRRRISRMISEGGLRPLEAPSEELESVVGLANLLIKHCTTMERRLIGENRRIREILDGMDLLVALCTTSGDVTFANRAMRDLFDSLEPLVGRKIWEIGDVEDRERIRDRFLATAEGAPQLIRVHLMEKRTSMVMNMSHVHRVGGDGEVLVLCRRSSAHIPPGIFA